MLNYSLPRALKGVEKNQVRYCKPIGMFGNGQKIYEFSLKGGLFLIVKGDPSQDAPIIGVGPHRFLARWMVTKKHPEVTITEVEKGNAIDFTESEVAEYEPLLDQLNEIW